MCSRLIFSNYHVRLLFAKPWLTDVNMGFQKTNMLSIVPASPMVRYGAPLDFTKVWEDYVDPKFPKVYFKKLVSVLMVDVWLVTSPIPHRFVGIYIRSFDDCLVGPIPLAPNSGNGGTGDD